MGHRGKCSGGGGGGGGSGGTSGGRVQQVRLAACTRCLGRHTHLSRLSRLAAPLPPASWRPKMSERREPCMFAPCSCQRVWAGVIAVGRGVRQHCKHAQTLPVVSAAVPSCRTASYPWPGSHGLLWYCIVTESKGRNAEAEFKQTQIGYIHYRKSSATCAARAAATEQPTGALRPPARLYMTEPELPAGAPAPPV